MIVWWQYGVAMWGLFVVFMDYRIVDKWQMKSYLHWRFIVAGSGSRAKKCSTWGICVFH